MDVALRGRLREEESQHEGDVRLLTAPVPEVPWPARPGAPPGGVALRRPPSRREANVGLDVGPLTSEGHSLAEVPASTQVAPRWPALPRKDGAIVDAPLENLEAGPGLGDVVIRVLCSGLPVRGSLYAPGACEVGRVRAVGPPRAAERQLSCGVGRGLVARAGRRARRGRYF